MPGALSQAKVIGQRIPQCNLDDPSQACKRKQLYENGLRKGMRPAVINCGTIIL